MTMGFKLDCDDDDDEESDGHVVDGHASSSEDPAVELAASLAICLDAVSKLRAMGALSVKVGDIEATFPPLPPPVVDAGGLPADRPMRQVTKPQDPGEWSEDEQAYLP